jgi:4-amino-4-deoxy-L-arabinose transferase-like glycosyltransferase
VGHPAGVLTVVGAWLAALAVCLAAVIFGQTARTAPRRRRRRSRAARVGLFLSLSGPWLAVLAAVAAGALTGAWLLAAAAAAVGVVLVALAGLTLHPH